jgi:hypothetical protein
MEARCGPTREEEVKYVSCSAVRTEHSISKKTLTLIPKDPLVDAVIVFDTALVGFFHDRGQGILTVLACNDRGKVEKLPFSTQKFDFIRGQIEHPIFNIDSRV